MPMYKKKESLVRLVVEVKKGEFENWYSAINDDKQGIQKSVSSLKKRILQKRHNGKFYNYTIYDNHSGNVIEGQQSLFDKNQSVYKLVIYDLNNRKLVRYSNVNELRPDNLINENLNHKRYNTALLFANPNAGYDGSLLAKWVKGTQVL